MGQSKKLSSRELAWLWQAWLLLPVVSLLLRLVGYRRTLGLLQTLCARKAASVLVEADAVALGWAVSIAVRYSVLPVNCCRDHWFCGYCYGALGSRQICASAFRRKAMS
jgi:hypothetical protein